MNKTDNWKTLKKETLEVGGNNFIEFSLKQNPDNQRLIGISKGWFSENQDKRYKTNILFSIEKLEEFKSMLDEVVLNETGTN